MSSTAAGVRPNGLGSGALVKRVVGDAYACGVVRGLADFGPSGERVVLRGGRWFETAPARHALKLVHKLDNLLPTPTI